MQHESLRKYKLRFSAHKNEIDKPLLNQSKDRKNCEKISPFVDGDEPKSIVKTEPSPEATGSVEYECIQSAGLRECYVRNIAEPLLRL